MNFSGLFADKKAPSVHQLFFPGGLDMGAIIYLDAFDQDYQYEITVYIKESKLSDFSSLSDMWFSMLSSSLIDNYKNWGINVYDYEVYTHNTLKYLKLMATTDNSAYLEYITVINGKEIDICFLVDHTKLSLKDNNFGDTIVNSLKLKSSLTTYNISTLGMSLSLSNDFDVVFSKSIGEMVLGSKTLLLQAENKNTDFLFNVSLAHEDDSVSLSFNLLDNDTANTLLSYFASLYEMNEVTVDQSYIAEFSGIKYLVYYVNTPLSSYEQIIYLTILRGKEIILYFYPPDFSGSISSETEELIRKIMESIQYDDYMVGKKEFNRVVQFNGDFSVLNGISFGMTKEEIIQIEREKNHSADPWIWEAKGNIKYEKVSFYESKLKLFETESRDYYFDKNGRMFHICFLLGLDDSKNEALNNKNYYDAYHIFESLYGEPIYYSDGYFFPLLSEQINAWKSSINCLQNYSQWILKYDNYYVLAEVFLVKTTLYGVYDCFASYTYFSPNEVEPLLGKSIKLY